MAKSLFYLLICTFIITSCCIDQRGDYEFEYKPSKVTVKEYRNYSGITSVDWGGNNLTVDGLILGTCSDPNLKLLGDYKVNGSLITLTVSETESTYKCFGVYDIRFKIRNLKRDNYTIELYKTEDTGIFLKGRKEISA